MTDLFLIVAEQSLRLSGVILFLWVLRTMVRRIPGSALYLLWILVFVGLIFPFKVEIPYHTSTPVSVSEPASPHTQRGKFSGEYTVRYLPLAFPGADGCRS